MVLASFHLPCRLETDGPPARKCVEKGLVYICQVVYPADQATRLQPCEDLLASFGYWNPAVMCRNVPPPSMEVLALPWLSHGQLGKKVPAVLSVPSDPQIPDQQARHSIFSACH
jgi:hypothetical protein